MARRCLEAVVLLLLVSGAESSYPTLQIQYSWPLRLGGEIGVNYLDFLGFVTSTGPYATASAGRDGIGLNAGIKGSIMMIAPIATAGFGVSGLYLWEGTDAVYLGARGSASVHLITVFGGAYRQLSGERDDDWLFSLGVGVGLP